jgi:putative transposase
VRARHRHVVEALGAKFPRAAAHLDAARGDILAFTAFPREIWRQIWSNNPQSVNRLSGDTIVLVA